jgi:hypothetical protein
MPYRALGLIVSITGVAVLALFSLPKPAHADDPQSHCAKVGNDDTVRTIPPILIAGAATLFHEPANEAASHRDMYVYRCMGGSWHYPLVGMRGGQGAHQTIGRSRSPWFHRKSVAASSMMEKEVVSEHNRRFMLIGLVDMTRLWQLWHLTGRIDMVIA